MASWNSNLAVSLGSDAARAFFWRDEAGEAADGEPLTLRAKLKSNLLSLWDCDPPADRGLSSLSQRKQLPWTGTTALEIQAEWA